MKRLILSISYHRILLPVDISADAVMSLLNDAKWVIADYDEKQLSEEDCDVRIYMVDESNIKFLNEDDKKIEVITDEL